MPDNTLAKCNHHSGFPDQAAIHTLNSDDFHCSEIDNYNIHPLQVPRVEGAAATGKPDGEACIVTGD